MFYAVSVIALGFLLDLLFGDPHWLPHPVRLIGWLIEKLEKLLRAVFPKTKTGERIGGTLLVVLVVMVSGAASWGLLYLAREFGGKPAAFLLEAFMCYQLLAVHALYAESMNVRRALQKADLAAARQAVSMIVGRDTERLSPIQVTKAAIETVAENTSDGVVAPLFFLMLGGAPLGFCYKAVNTLDSMIGYKNEEYRYFGTFAARLDDAANFFPARISALLMIVAAAFLGLDSPGAARIWMRDRQKHASPNSAQTEAACAGALGVQLAGSARYGGVLYEKPTIGDDLRPPVADDIRKANWLMAGTSFLALVFFSICKVLFIFLF
ncbi:MULTISPECIES: adenosylcobinamide-phosphate synthase CbiB [Anaerotruncus]|jgi:adenosylcobinamide-phosphate synthase|uniref:adenosylcobinamide-phosphate synthase CbiB n=1 Tax=Anaerotruncus TaxID=244127 RepID=UPI000E4D3027|nr:MULTISPECIES: adenosylcobinamide-phosphate synthase CbiB [Anaerotruncus]RGX55986.1 cobalamin biosynthesis protein CobD [Anaerotruncus sp. AF02-27]